jgi:hypothetical protein
MRVIRILFTLLMLSALSFQGLAQDSLFTTPDVYIREIKSQAKENSSSCEQACELLYLNPKLWKEIKSSCGNYIKTKKVSKKEYTIRNSLVEKVTLYHDYSSIQDVLLSNDEVLSSYLKKRFELVDPLDARVGRIPVYGSSALVNYQKGAYLIQLVITLKKSDVLEVGLAELIVQGRR